MNYCSFKECTLAWSKFLFEHLLVFYITHWLTRIINYCSTAYYRRPFLFLVLEVCIIGNSKQCDYSQCLVVCLHWISTSVILLLLGQLEIYTVETTEIVLSMIPFPGFFCLVQVDRNRQDACYTIARESYKLWLQHENRTDDVTLIIVHVEGLSNVWYLDYISC